MTFLSEIYDVTLKRGNRGAAKNGWVRATVGETYVTHKDFKEYERLYNAFKKTNGAYSANSATLLEINETKVLSAYSYEEDYDGYIKIATYDVDTDNENITLIDETTSVHGDKTTFRKNMKIVRLSEYHYCIITNYAYYLSVYNLLLDTSYNISSFYLAYRYGPNYVYKLTSFSSIDVKKMHNNLLTIVMCFADSGWTTRTTLFTASYDDTAITCTVATGEPLDPMNRYTYDNGIYTTSGSMSLIKIDASTLAFSWILSNIFYHNVFTISETGAPTALYITPKSTVYEGVPTPIGAKACELDFGKSLVVISPNDQTTRNLKICIIEYDNNYDVNVLSSNDYLFGQAGSAAYAADIKVIRDGTALIYLYHTDGSACILSCSYDNNYNLTIGQETIIGGMPSAFSMVYTSMRQTTDNIAVLNSDYFLACHDMSIELFEIL